jgi:hypothetical protein
MLALDTASWAELELSVLTDIYLDPKNVRLETPDASVEADILEDLFANEGALELVEAISKIGYLTHETPIVVKRRGKYIVVEGNRRLAALKAIQNPMIIPGYQTRIAAFTRNITNVEALAKIRVMVAPNQELANQLIAAIHTSNMRERWNPERQAVFFQAQIDAGRTYTQLKERYPTIEVGKFVFRAHIVNALRGVKYDEPELRQFFNTKQWRKSSSTLARIYQSRDFLDLTGFVMDDKGVVRRTISDEHFKAVATIIIRGLKDNELNTRTIGTVKSARFTRLMSELREVVSSEVEETDQETSGSSSPRPSASSESGESDSRPSPTSGAGGSTRDSRPRGQSGDPGESEKPEQSAKKPKPKKEKLKFLPVGGLVVPDQYPAALRLHFEELSVLEVQKFPNSTFLMLRAVLEKSIKAYAEAKRIDIRGSGNSGQGYVQLFHSLKWFEEYLVANGPRSLIQPVMRIRTGTLMNYTSTNDALNAINHNHKFFVDPEEVISLWNSIDAVMRELMVP